MPPPHDIELFHFPFTNITTLPFPPHIHIMKLTCSCCFDEELSVNHAVACENQHISCTECILRAVHVAVGENSIVRCFAQNCGQIFPDNVIARAFPFGNPAKDRYSIILHRYMLSEANVDNLYACPFCDNQVIIEDQQAQFFRCNGCNQKSCRNCHQAEHTGQCMPIHEREDFETDNFLLTCQCGVRMYRGDACNKLSCPQCRKTWCWICKAKLGGRPYEHFRPQGICELYGERPANQVFAASAQPAVVRNHIELVGFLGNGTVGMGLVEEEAGACPGAPGAPTHALVEQAAEQNHLDQQFICIWTKSNGEPCTYRAKHTLGVCGYHIRSARRAAQVIDDHQEIWL